MRAHIFVIFVVDYGVAVAGSIVLVDDVDFGTHLGVRKNITAAKKQKSSQKNVFRSWISIANTVLISKTVLHEMNDFNELRFLRNQ